MNNKEILKMILMIGFMFLILYLLYKGGYLFLPNFMPKVIYMRQEIFELYEF